MACALLYAVAAATAQSPTGGDAASNAWPAARKAIERRCAGCHLGEGVRTPSVPRLPALLTPGELATDPTLVQPGNPDASPLFTMFQMRFGAHDLMADHSAARVAADEHVAVRDWIAGLPPTTPARHVAQSRGAASGEPALELRLALNAARFKSGDPITITATTNRACHLTVVGLDGTGRGTVLFPNDFAATALIEAEKPVTIPADGAAYVLRADRAGRETIAAICQIGQVSPFAVHHDFGRRRFTELGDYRAFLFKTWTDEVEARRVGAKPIKAKPRRRARRHALPPPPPPPGPVEQVRTAVQFDVD